MISLSNFENEFWIWANFRAFDVAFDLSVEIIHQALSSDWNILLRERTNLSEISNHVDSDGKIVVIFRNDMFQAAKHSEN